MSKLRDKVGNYGLGSAEVMQPVKYDIFECQRTQLAGTVVAQNTALSQQDARAENWLRRNSGFGSTGPPQVHWITVLTKDRPEKVCTLSIPGATPSEIRLCGLLGTGADIMILSLAAWPLEWPLDSVQTSVMGLAGTAQCYMSQRPVVIMNPEGQTAMVWPHVTAETRVNLWGRDFLATWRVRIRTDF
ncbi:hypothetical protein DUI87_29424 [Hirundo rustica rustica]|uniref:Peptidase A2 domain-containing protein n=1 Tax=Hirundo rustica rustica TaxID=333673 RepID=A0A3M0J759_HIRRU|nr:hypothetical protein DUI87_29424 [Hirundo rustica rustica]